MLTLAQRIEYAAAAIASSTGTTSDQVVTRLLGNQVRGEVEQLRLLEQELRRVRRPDMVGQVLVSVYHRGA